MTAISGSLCLPKLPLAHGNHLQGCVMQPFRPCAPVMYVYTTGLTELNSKVKVMLGATVCHTKSSGSGYVADGLVSAQCI